MKRLINFVVIVMLATSIAGCLRTYVFEKDRVDQEISGNRGVLTGKAPSEPARKTPPKRTIIGVDVEIPPFYASESKEAAKRTESPKATDRELWGNRGYLSSGEKAPEQAAYPYEAERVEKTQVIKEVRPQEPEEKAQKKPFIFKPSEKAAEKKKSFSEYKVKKGDTLSGIAAKSNIYGDAGKWKKIYDANKDVLKDPSRVYPGQVLRIPALEEESKKGSRVK